MMMDWLEKVATGALVLSALVVAAAATRVAFFPASTTTEYEPFSYIDDWNELVEAGRLVGSAEAPVKILEFADLQCPFCRRFHGSLREVQEEFGSDVAFVFLHYPLDMHPQAMPAALGAECAGEQERFAEYLDVVYADQDSLGNGEWASLAARAGVPDTVAFNGCMARDFGRDVIDRDKELGRRIGLNGTPTVIVNGWLLRPTPYDTLSGVVARALRGEEPFDRPGG